MLRRLKFIVDYSRLSRDRLPFAISQLLIADCRTLAKGSVGEAFTELFAGALTTRIADSSAAADRLPFHVCRFTIHDCRSPTTFKYTPVPGASCSPFRCFQKPGLFEFQ
jgi:hypothetical protein